MVTRQGQVAGQSTASTMVEGLATEIPAGLFELESATSLGCRIVGLYGGAKLMAGLLGSSWYGELEMGTAWAAALIELQIVDFVCR